MVEPAEPCLKVEDASYGQGVLTRRMRCLNVPYSLLTRRGFPIIIVVSLDGAGTDG
jgi:hypothetical protein